MANVPRIPTSETTTPTKYSRKLRSRRTLVAGGVATLDDLVATARQEHAAIEAYASDSEGELVARLHAARTDGTQAVLINPGALTHYSYALRDALELVAVPKSEVHLSQVHAREPFRRHSVISPVVDVTIAGAGAFGYRLAVLAALDMLARRGQTP